MPYYVYIIKSEKFGTYYKGFTEDYNDRLRQHNEGISKYTSNKGPWRLIYVEVHLSKREALIRELKLKKCNPDYFEWLTIQSSNILLS